MFTTEIDGLDVANGQTFQVACDDDLNEIDNFENSTTLETVLFRASELPKFPAANLAHLMNEYDASGIIYA